MGGGVPFRGGLVAIPSHGSPFRFHAILALILSAAGTVGLWWLLGAANTVPLWLGCWLASVNVVAIAYYAYDKVRARGNGSRVPELVLHGLSAIGGSPGAYLAMALFRHKTVKSSFRILFWCIVILQASLAAYVAKLLWWS
jgi:uncharacterized membrane protein YsdA (DUF1294 family)